MTPRGLIRGIWLGTRRYAPVLALQERLWTEREAGRIPDTLLFLEHEPVVTLGRGADPRNVLLSEAALRSRGFDRVQTSRGGDVTLHAPGQLVGYPILDLRPDRCDVRRYVKDLTEAMRRVVARHGIGAGEVPGMVGLWVDRATPSAFPEPGKARDLVKVGAVGVRISHWVTQHGFALNLTTRPDVFSVIVPCGIPDHAVTSVKELVGVEEPAEAAAAVALTALGEIFGASTTTMEDWSVGELDELPLGTLGTSSGDAHAHPPF